MNTKLVHLKTRSTTTMDGRWTEVRHKKKSAIIKDNDEITYFVSNVPKDVRREEIWSTFQSYGAVSDVFYPGK